jgi:hypothetical protein
MWPIPLSSVEEGAFHFRSPWLGTPPFLTVRLEGPSAAAEVTIEPRQLGRAEHKRLTTSTHSPSDRPLNTRQQFGAVLDISVITAVFKPNGSLADPAPVTRGYLAALLVAAGLSALGVPSPWCWGGRRPQLRFRPDE